jgi:inosine-uridine nucleoside N-ribohydrolase
MEAFGGADKSIIANFVANSHMHYMDFYREWEGIDGCFPHDSLAVLAALEPERFFRLRGQVLVEVDSPKRGQTTFLPAASSHIEVVTGGELKWAREVLARLLEGKQLRVHVPTTS